jgi:hypothetical protein
LRNVKVRQLIALEVRRSDCELLCNLIGDATTLGFGVTKSDLLKDYEERKSKAKETSAIKSRVSIITIISLIISVAAFLLSSYVTILGSFRIKDDIRIVERGLPIVMHEPGSPNLKIEAPRQWVITNAGNRAAAIAGGFVFFLKNNEQTDDCDKSILDNANLLGFTLLNLEPFVIEPRKVEIRSIQVRQFDEEGKPTDSLQVTVPIKNWDARSDQGVKLCLSVQVITPDQYSIVSELISRANWNWNKPQIIPDVKKLPTISKQQPWILISESKWGFFDKKD